MEASEMLFLTVSSNEKGTFAKTKTKIHSEYIKNQSNTLIVTQSTLYGLCRIKDEFTWGKLGNNSY